MPAGRVKTPLRANEGASAKLKDEQMQRLIQGALGAWGTELFYLKAHEISGWDPL